MVYIIQVCCVYSEKLLMMGGGTVRNIQSFNPKIKFEKLVHLLGFIIIRNLSRCASHMSVKICYLLDYKGPHTL